MAEGLDTSSASIALYSETKRTCLAIAPTVLTGRAKRECLVLSLTGSDLTLAKLNGAALLPLKGSSSSIENNRSRLSIQSPESFYSPIQQLLTGQTELFQALQH